MRSPARRPVASLISWLRTRPLRRPPLARRPLVEWLEDRCVPATLHQAGSVLTITLDNANEALGISSSGSDYLVASSNNFVNDGSVTSGFSGFGTTSGDISAADFTRINIVDSAAGTSVAFNDSLSFAYSTPFTINLSDAAAGGVTFNGSSQFNSGLTVSARGDVTSAAGSSITTDFASSGDISLASTAGSVILAGALANNHSAAATRLTGNSVQLGVSTTVSDVLNITSTAGSITQLAGGFVSAGGIATLSAAGGGIALNGAGNTFAGGVSLTASGANDVSLFSSSSLGLSGVTMGTGSLSLTSQGDILGNGTIVTSGPATFTVDTNAGSVVLGSNPNNFSNTVTIAQTNGGTVQNVALRNISQSAQVPAIAGLSLNNYNLIFDNAPVTLPATTISGMLSVAAGGALKQSGAIQAAGGDFTVLGNFPITLTDANTITGPVSFHATSSDGTAGAAVSFNNTVGVSLGQSELGLSAFTVTAATGDITQTGRIIQKAAAAAATFTAAAGATVDLRQPENDFSGPVIISGPSVTTVRLTNSDVLAAFPTLPAGVTDLTLNFASAPVVLPALTLDNLNVSAQAVLQKLSPGGLHVTGLAAFTSGSGPIVLSAPANDFNQVSIASPGLGDVFVTDANAISVGDSNLGKGRLTIKAGGAITEFGAGISQGLGAGAAAFSTGAAAIDLSNPGNQLAGVVSASNAGNNAVSIASAGDLTLGAIVTAGPLTVTGSGNVAQAAGTALAVGGAATFTGSTLELTSAGNALTGGVSLNTPLSSASLRNSTAVDLNSSSVGGLLSVAAGGPITQSGAITSSGASFDAGTSAINLGLFANNFGSDSVSLISTGSAAVNVRTANQITLGDIRLGTGPLTVTANGDINQSVDAAIVQAAGGGTLTFDSASFGVFLDSQCGAVNGPMNSFTGPLAVNAANVSVVTRGDLAFTPSSNFTGKVALSAGGQLTLPAADLTLQALSVNARSTTIGHNITAQSGDIALNTAVVFPGAVTLDTSAGAGSVRITGDVAVAGPLTVNLSSVGSLFEQGGRWNQGDNLLTITGGASAPAPFVIEGGTFVMGTGTIDVAGPGGMTVQGGTLAVNGVVTFAGPGNLEFDGGSRLQVALGAGAKLVKPGAGNISVGDGARLTGTGLASASNQTVLDAGSGTIFGFFDQSVDASSAPHAFLMGSDIVVPTYTGVTVAVVALPLAASQPTGFQSDSDQYTVSVTGGTGLVVIKDVAGNVDAVVRNASAATTLKIVTKQNVGDGITRVGGIAINGAGAATISAATSDLVGDVNVQGPLASITVRDMTSMNLTAGGPATQATTIAGRNLEGVAIDVGGTISKLAVSSFESGRVAAQSFGTITAAGAFEADLVNRAAGGTAVSSATVGSLGGFWDLRGSVGAVKATTRTDNWTLGGVGPNGFAINSGLLADVNSLDLARARDVSIEAAGRLNTMAAASWDHGAARAAWFGTITIGTAARPGNLDSVDLTATGNAGGPTALGLNNLTVNGNMFAGHLLLANGNAKTISVSQVLANSTLRALHTAAGGGLGAISAAELRSDTVDAVFADSIKATDNHPAAIFGDIRDSKFVLHGLSSSPTLTTLATVAATGQISESDFTIENGSVTTFSAGRELLDSSVRLLGTGGNLGTITARQWQHTDVTARSIGRLTVTKAPQSSPRNAALHGDMQFSAINAFGVNPTTRVGIGLFSVDGDLFGTGTHGGSSAAAPNLITGVGGAVTAPGGITTFTVGGQVEGMPIRVESPTLGPAAGAGRIGNLSAGSWSQSPLFADSLGTVGVAGDFASSGVAIHSGVPFGPSVGLGVGSWKIGGDLANATVIAPFGIGTLNVAGAVDQSVVSTDNPLSPASGAINILTIGSADFSTLRAGSLGTVLVGAGGAGDLLSTTLAVAGGSGASPSVAIGRLAVAGDVQISSIIAPLTVSTFTAGGKIADSTIAVGYGAGAQLATLAAGGWSNSNLTARSVNSWTISHVEPQGAVGNMTGGTITLLGNTKGVALGAFNTFGTVSGVDFRVNDGDVSSFTVGRFFDSRLLVGFRASSGIDPFGAANPPDATNWNANRRIVRFATTAAFDPTDVADTASFRGALVVAANLGTVNLKGIDPTPPADGSVVTFGVGFRAAGGSAGALTIAGSLKAPPFAQGGFRYQGLSG